MKMPFPAKHIAGTAVLALLFFCISISSQLSAQSPFSQRGPKDRLNDPLGGQGFNFGQPTSSSEPITVTSEFKLLEGKTKGQLTITAKLAAGWHVFTLRKKGVPVPNLPTRIKVGKSEDFRLTGPFKADQDPIKHFDTGFEKDVYYYEDSVVWTAPIELADNALPDDVAVALKIEGQVCEKACEQFNESLIAKFAGYKKPPAGEYAADGSRVRLTGALSPAQATPGSTVTLTLTAEIDEDWHVYENKPMPAEDSNQPTVIFFTKSNGWDVSTPQPSSPPHVSADGSLGYHEGSITWTVDLQVAADAEPGNELKGFIVWQTCKEQSCLAPEVVDFAVTVPVGEETVAGEIPLGFVKQLNFAEAKEKAAELGNRSAADAGKYANYSPAFVLAIAFLAGLILNVMPCVLPVIGLKIVAFVQQAGENRARVFMLNLAFVLGLLSVFMVLASLAVFLGLGWGGLFKSLIFQIVMLTVVFAFALSFLGVWEIPIPGFVGGSSASKMAQKEGYGGAFSKGILTTLLATPCSGPMLIPAITWAIAQPAWLTYLTFLSLGLGMASPYLLIGLAPGLVRSLPKPGAWMDTFKQLMGFVLMGTAVFLAAGVGSKFLIPVISFMVAVGLACWWIGKTPSYAEIPKQLKAWGAGLAVLAIGGFICFGLMVSHHELAWQPYSKVVLEDEVKEGNTVFVDFTADW